MFWKLLGILVICALTWLYVRWTRVRQYWAKRGVPHLPPHPVMGSLTFLQRQNPAVWMIELYQKFNAPYIGAWWFWRPVLIVHSPELARNILIKDSANFRDRFVRSGASDPIGSLNISLIKEPQWSIIRRRLTTVFTASKLKAFQNLYDTKSNELIQRIESSKDKTKINLRNLFTDYTTDIIGTAAFGVKTNATLTGEDPMRVVTKAFMNFDLYRGLCWSSIFFIPELVDIFRFSLFPKWATDYFRKVLRIASEQRKEENRDLLNPKDLLDALLSLKDRDDVSDDIIVANAAMLLFGGFETSGSIISFACYELAFRPEMQDKLYAELVQVKNDNEDGLDIAKLAELQFLNCIIKEALRKYTPMGWLDRVASKDYKIDDKLTIPAGMPVYINAIGMHYNEDLFPQPKEFRPERFLPENEKDIKQATYMPFGEGPRNCIGQRFGLVTVRHALANMVLKYKLSPVENATKPNDLEYDKRALFVLPGEILHINFIPRR
ncbi:unnamed protein product [Colias eurytheme]|nr:unnamed protein product [Colias eurytheme]